MAQSGAEAADGSVGVAYQAGDRSILTAGGAQDGEDVVVLALHRVGRGTGVGRRKGVACAPPTAVHEVAGVAMGEQPRDGHPACVVGKASVNEDDCGAAAEAEIADAGAVGGVDAGVSWVHSGGGWGRLHRSMLARRAGAASQKGQGGRAGSTRVAERSRNGYT